MKIFKPSAEKWGYIIVSSNNSRNGNWQWVFDAADAMFVDSHQRYHINPKRIYTAGFSGGGRAAIAVARMTGQVAGIIGCGSGSSNPKEYQFNEIWLYAQPNSVWALWSRAKLFALAGDKQEALTYLELAHENGMSKAESITQQSAFKILHEERRYKKLLSELSQ